MFASRWLSVIVGFIAGVLVAAFAGFAIFTLKDFVSGTSPKSELTGLRLFGALVGGIGFLTFPGWAACAWYSEKDSIRTWYWHVSANAVLNLLFVWLMISLIGFDRAISTEAFFGEAAIGKLAILSTGAVISSLIYWVVAGRFAGTKQNTSHSYIDAKLSRLARGFPVSILAAGLAAHAILAFGLVIYRSASFYIILYPVEILKEFSGIFLMYLGFSMINIVKYSSITWFITLVIIEWQNFRDLKFYLLSGLIGVSLPFALLFLKINQYYILYVFTAIFAGLVGGWAYWLIAGQHNGELQRRPTETVAINRE